MSEVNAVRNKTKQTLMPLSMGADGPVSQIPSSQPIYLQHYLISKDPDNVIGVPLLDLAPRYIWRQPKGERKVIVRSFRHNGRLYRLSIVPSSVDEVDGLPIRRYPGEREQLVEEVVRYLSLKLMRVCLEGELVIPFRTFAICRELKKRGHLFNKAEVDSALHTLHLSRLLIESDDEGGAGSAIVFDGSVLPHLKLSMNRGGVPSELMLNEEFIRAQARLEPASFNFDSYMQLRTHSVRWLFKSLSYEISRDETAGMLDIYASRVAEGAGVLRPRPIEVINEVEKAIKALTDHGAIEAYLRTNITEGKLYVDTIYTIKLSDRFLASIKTAQQHRDFSRRVASRYIDLKAAQSFTEISREQFSRLQFESVLAKGGTGDLRISASHSHGGHLSVA